jgi:hypothetical protein
VLFNTSCAAFLLLLAGYDRVIGSPIPGCGVWRWQRHGRERIRRHFVSYTIYFSKKFRPVRFKWQEESPDTSPLRGGSAIYAIAPKPNVKQQNDAKKG